MAPLLWAALGALGWSMFSDKRKRSEALAEQQLAEATGVAVGANCESFQTINTERAQLTFMAGYINARMQGYSDPSQIATLIVRRYSPRCLAGGQIGSLAELEFYDSVFVDVLAEMLDGDVIGDALFAEYQADHDEWFAQQAQELEA
jgi:hypothetical protein